jgi:hypothetical protein
MIEYHGGPHHGRTVKASMGPRTEQPDFMPHRVPFIVEGTRFLHPIGDDHFHVAIYVAKDGKLVHEGDRRLTKPYPTVVEPRVWPRLELV